MPKTTQAASETPRGRRKAGGGVPQDLRAESVKVKAEAEDNQSSILRVELCRWKENTLGDSDLRHKGMGATVKAETLINNPPLPIPPSVTGLPPNPDAVDVKPGMLKDRPDVIRELTKIWENKKSMPTALSRATWAKARSVHPSAIHSWFHRRKKTAKAKGGFSEGLYALDVNAPNVWVGNGAPQNDAPVQTNDVMGDECKHGNFNPRLASPVRTLQLAPSNSANYTVEAPFSPSPSSLSYDHSSPRLSSALPQTPRDEFAVTWRDNKNDLSPDLYATPQKSSEFYNAPGCLLLHSSAVDTVRPFLWLLPPVDPYDASPVKRHLEDRAPVHRASMDELKHLNEILSSSPFLDHQPSRSPSNSLDNSRIYAHGDTAETPLRHIMSTSGCIYASPIHNPPLSGQENPHKFITRPVSTSSSSSSLGEYLPGSPQTNSTRLDPAAPTTYQPQLSEEEIFAAISRRDALRYPPLIIEQEKLDGLGAGINCPLETVCNGGIKGEMPNNFTCALCSKTNEALQDMTPINEQAYSLTYDDPFDANIKHRLYDGGSLNSLLSSPPSMLENLRSRLHLNLDVSIDFMTPETMELSAIPFRDFMHSFSSTLQHSPELDKDPVAWTRKQIFESMLSGSMPLTYLEEPFKLDDHMRDEPGTLYLPKLHLSPPPNWQMRTTGFIKSDQLCSQMY